MTLSVARLLLAGLAALGTTLAASVFGLSVEQFLAGVFSGGILTAAYPTVRDRIG